MGLFQLKGTSGPVMRQGFALDGNLLIGTAADCTIRVEGKGIAPHHADVSVTARGRVLLRNLDPSAQTLVNGVAVDETELAGGDEIRVGTCRWLLQAPGLRPQRTLHDQPSAPRRGIRTLLLLVLLAVVAVLAWQRGWLGV